MNLIKGLKDFKDRRKLSNAELSRMLGVSDSMVSQYLSGKSGMSLEILAALLRAGMSLEEAFDVETAEAIKRNLSPEIQNPADPLNVVVEGLRKILEQIKPNRLI